MFKFKAIRGRGTLERGRDGLSGQTRASTSYLGSEYLLRPTLVAIAIETCSINIHIQTELTVDRKRHKKGSKIEIKSQF